LPLDPIYLATAIEAALAAGRTHLAYFRQDPRIEKKGPIDLVTAADLATERAFRTLIGGRFPSHAVLGEEAGAGGSSPAAARFRWIIDPLDGTTNFAHGLAFFCVSIALQVDGQTEIAVVYDPVAQELFSAERGRGAWVNGTRLRVSTHDALLDALLCTGFPYSIREDQARQVDVFARFLGRARAVRRLGSAALDLSYVAAGRFDGFWEEQLHAWDIAAGVLLVQEAGGRVTGYDDEPVDLFAGRIVASNGPLHAAMLEVIRDVLER
jgi:myo-inositol-1(or 4)-monophosphatase